MSDSPLPLGEGQGEGNLDVFRYSLAVTKTVNIQHKFVRPTNHSIPSYWRIACCLALLVAIPRTADASTLVLKDGRTLEGRYVELTSVAESPLTRKVPAGEVPLTPLILVDDGLRRTYVHHDQIQQKLDEKAGRDVRINIWQPVAEQGGGVGRIGRATHVTPFDEHGRRIYEMNSNEGPLAIVQGITEVTPLYTKVEGLTGGPKPIIWDMRIATSSIPRETLRRVLSGSVRKDDVEGRLQLVRLYLESERYRDAGLELEQIIADFPDRKELRQDIGRVRELGAKLIVKEIQLRAKAGQHERAHALLSQFPPEGVAGETLQQVRELLEKYTAEDARRKALVDNLKAQIAKIADENGRRLAENFAKEIETEVNEDAIARLASFERLADDAALSPEQKAALAISGWLVGANQATDNFQAAVSLAHVRDKIVAYLRDPLAQNRSKIASELRDTEGATLERVAQILKLMKPPLEVPKNSERASRLHELTVTGRADEGDSRCLIQLPPEYDPLRHYPTIVTMPDAGVLPEQMLDFWAGPIDKDKNGDRLGQATRQGYIVIAIDWQAPHQFTYDYSTREHQAVLGALRDACRRFAIDVDKVFLTGHGIGGDAAWDIGIAHPDVWAGVIPIVATADRYVGRYAKNARYLSWYFVAGELDGDKMSHNARELDRYLKPNSDVTVVEFLGRGYEPFGDEVQRIFDWMSRRQRSMPQEIDCVSLRPSDSFFWWLEASGLPAKSMVAPENWPPPKTVRPTPVTGKRLQTNKVTVQVQAEKTTVWLLPELVDFKQPLVVEVNNRPISPRNRIVQPDIGVLLEDVRTRADRQHPFWAKLSTQ
jgi:pimeloyl-ACP methyl ester carboxylesterase